MVHPSGRAPLLRMASLVQRLLHSQMGLSVALPTIPYISRSSVPSGMALYECCTLHASAIAAPAPCVHNVKKAAPRSSHDGIAGSPDHAEHVLTRTERAHWRLSWDQRLARNARPLDAPRLVVTLHGLPATFATSFGFDLLATA